MRKLIAPNQQGGDGYIVPDGDHDYEIPNACADPRYPGLDEIEEVLQGQYDRDRNLETE